ncbi:hypothetical protein [Stutzerimonas stutzeri]|nr:hypothetical protein [Stutzerimonas stutzeri]
MTPTPEAPRGRDTTDDEQPDITMTDAGEKEPGEDPDFDDAEIDGEDDRH